MRSLLKKIPILALTATATLATKNKIVRALEMDTCEVISQSPNRKNIAYSVQAVTGGAHQTFGPIIKELREKTITFERIIIYCQTIKICSHIYGVFKEKLGEDMYVSTGDITSGMVEMYHSRIDELNRDNIVKDFSIPNGHIRDLIATIAYGMGINCQGVKSIVHYGPSRNVEAYLQESGRAGRDSSDMCKAVILYSNVMLKYCDEPMTEYARNSTVCRRTMLLSYFQSELYDIEKPLLLHECCDICQRHCHCDGTVCMFCFCPSSSSNNVPTTNNICLRNATSAQVNKLQDKLQYIEEFVTKDVMSHVYEKMSMFVTSLDFVFGFGPHQIQQVLDNIDKLFTISDIHKFVDIWHPQIATEILVAITQVFEDTDFQDNDEFDDEKNDLLTFWSWGFDQDDELLANIPLELMELTETDVEEFESEV